MLKPYRYIFWDWNGTLLNDSWLCVDIMNGLLRKYRLPSLDERRYREIFDFPVRGYYQKLGFDFRQTPFEKIGSEFIDEYKQRWRMCELQPDARRVLQILKESGLGQAILSAANISMLRVMVKYYELDSFFQNIIGLNHQYATSKLQVGKSCLQKLHYNKEQIVLIGDTTHDYQVARELGIECILFARGHHSSERLLFYETRLIDSINALLDILL